MQDQDILAAHIKDSYGNFRHTYIHTNIHTYIHTCLYLPTYVGTYILHPTHPTGGGGEAEVPCMIVGFQGGSTPNPRNHPHRIHTYYTDYTIQSSTMHTPKG